MEGVIHWVSADESQPAEVRLYDRLFTAEETADLEGDLMDYLNPGSLEVLTSCRVEPALATGEPGSRYQFERIGYFCIVSRDSAPGRLVFNRIVPLRDSWGKISRTGKA